MVTLVLVFCCLVSPANALWLVTPCSQGGVWPQNWPKALQPLRKQSRQLVFAGVKRPGIRMTHTTSKFEIPFADRKQFESAWPHIVKLKNESAPLIFLPVTDVRVQTGNRVETKKTSGVRILVRSPIRPNKPRDPKAAERALRLLNDPKADPKALGRPVPASYVTGIELVVDGHVVDLNRIRLPADTRIIDKRFPD